MGRGTFDSSNYLMGSQSELNVTPLTLAARFNPNSAASFLRIWGLGDNGENNANVFLLSTFTGGVLGAEVWDENGNISRASSTNVVDAGEWNIGVARFGSVTSRKAMLNGDLASEGSDTESREPNAWVDQCGIGVVPDTGPHSAFAGYTDWVAGWNIELTDEQAIAIGKGVPPQQVAPGNLKMFCHLSADTANETFSIGGVTLTETGNVGTIAVQSLRRARMAYSRAHGRSTWHFTGVAAPVTGTGASTLAAVTQAGSGEETFAGTAAQQPAAALQSGVGVMHPQGTAAQALAALEQSAAGVETLVATAGQDLPAIEQAGVGSHVAAGASGTASQTLGAVVQSGAGVEAISGTAAQILGAVTQDATGVQIITGTGAQALAAILQSAAGTSVTGVSGTGAQELAALEQAGAGHMHAAGVAAQVLAAVVQSGSGLITTSYVAVGDGQRLVVDLGDRTIAVTSDRIIVIAQSDRTVAVQ